MSRNIVFFMLFMLCTALCPAQMIRNSNQSVMAKVDADGTVRNSNNSVIARISGNGDIRDSNNHLLGRIGSSGDVRNSNNSYLGKIEGNGIVRNSNNSLLGKVERDGTVRDSNNHVIGYARGVPMRYAAVYFYGLILFKKHTCQNILTNSIIQKDIYGMGSPSGSLAIMGAGS